MKPTASTMVPFLTLILSLLPLVHAQIGYDPETSKFLCPYPDTHYCAAASLDGPSIIACTSAGTTEVRSCLHELSDILPVGYEGTAVCYESPSHSGNAVCAFNGTGYATSGLKVNVPETVLCDDLPTFPMVIGDEDYDESEAIDEIVPPIVPEMISRDELSYNTGTSPSPAAHLPEIPSPEYNDDLGTFPEALIPIPPDISGSQDACSDPWSRKSTTDADILTLNIVLVVPTPSPTISQIGSASTSVLAVSQPLSRALIGQEALGTTRPTLTPSVAPAAVTSSSLGDSAVNETGSVETGVPTNATSEVSSRLAGLLDAVVLVCVLHAGLELVACLWKFCI